MIDRGVVYEPHPVSPQRKAELRSRGFIIRDEIYKDVDEQREEAERIERSAAEKRDAIAQENRDRMEAFFNARR